MKTHVSQRGSQPEIKSIISCGSLNTFSITYWAHNHLLAKNLILSHSLRKPSGLFHDFQVSDKDKKIRFRIFYRLNYGKVAFNYPSSSTQTPPPTRRRDIVGWSSFRATIPHSIFKQGSQQIVEVSRTQCTAQRTDNARPSNLLIVILTSERSPTSPDLWDTTRMSVVSASTNTSLNVRSMMFCGLTIVDDAAPITASSVEPQCPDLYLVYIAMGGMSLPFWMIYC